MSRQRLFTEIAIRSMLDDWIASSVEAVLN